MFIARKTVPRLLLALLFACCGVSLSASQKECYGIFNINGTQVRISTVDTQAQIYIQAHHEQFRQEVTLKVTELQVRHGYDKVKYPLVAKKPFEVPTGGRIIKGTLFYIADSPNDQGGYGFMEGEFVDLKTLIGAEYR